MATHSRHIRSRLNSGRVQIRFERIDLLWQGVATNPYDGETVQCPLPKAVRDPETKRVLRVDPGFVVGPTVLDMLVRTVVRWDDLPEAVRAAAAQKHPVAVAVWQVRDTATLWPAPGQPQSRRTVREPEDEEAEEPPEPDHPFLTALASGGRIEDDPHYPGWTTVAKASTVNISEGCFRLAVGMHCGLAHAYRAIARQAEELWRQDLVRILEIWRRTQRAPGGILIEDPEVEELRPVSSISQELERLTLREACKFLGVDPDLDIKRPSGRPSMPENEGDILRMSIEDGQVVGEVIRAFQGIAVGTVLSSLTTATLVELLGALRTDGHDTDAEYLEAYLDAAAPDWREQAAEAAFGGEGNAPENPYGTLGVTPQTSDEDIASAFRALMQAASHLPSTAPQQRFTRAYKAIKAERKAAAAAQGATA